MTWLDERTIELELEDKRTFTIPLAPTNSIPGLKQPPCLFSGKLDGDPESGVVVNGCKGEDTEVLVTSKKILGNVYLPLFLSADGKTYRNL